MRGLKINFFIIVILYYIFSSNFSLAKCDDMSGLYEKKMELKEKDRQAFEKEKEPDVMTEERRAYKRQLEDIDLKYKTFIYGLFYEYERGEDRLFKECRELTKKDRYLFFVCNLIEYLKNKNEDKFLNNIPTDSDSLEALSELPDIIKPSYDQAKEPYPRIAADYGYGLFFLQGLVYDLAEKGNPLAMDKLLILRLRDGSGDIAHSLLILFDKSPDVILKNWKVIRKYQDKLGFYPGDLESKKAEKWIYNYQKICKEKKINAAVCNEVIEFFRRKKQEALEYEREYR